MFKLAGLIIDAYDDPAFVDHPRMTELLPSPDEIARFKDRDFAVVVKTAAGSHRKYPLATPSLLKVSAAYFREYGGQLPEEIRAAAQQRLHEAAERFGIKLAGVEPVPDAPTRSVFTLPAEGLDDGPPRTPTTKTAAAAIVQDELIRQFGRMRPSERALAVADLAKTAEVTDPRLLPYVPRSEFGTRLGEGLRQREFVLAGDAIKLAQFEALLAQFPRTDARTAAVLLDRFDRTAGLDGRVLDAYVTCWDGPVKQAAADPMDLQRARVERLASEHAVMVREYFDEAVASAFLRAPWAYYQTLATPPTKRVFDELCKQVDKLREQRSTERKGRPLMPMPSK